MLGSGSDRRADAKFGAITPTDHRPIGDLAERCSFHDARSPARGLAVLAPDRLGEDPVIVIDRPRLDRAEHVCASALVPAFGAVLVKRELARGLPWSERESGIELEHEHGSVPE